MLHRRLNRAISTAGRGRGGTSASNFTAVSCMNTAAYRSASSSGRMVFSPTMTRLARGRGGGGSFINDPSSPTFHLAIASDAEELGKDVDLGDDNLNLSAIEEYSADDMELRTRQMVGAYNSAIFAFCFYPSVDIVYLLNDLDLLPPIRPEASVAHWMADPRLILRQPRVLADIMGPERWDKLHGHLVELTENLTEFSPLVRCVKKHKLPRNKWLPFLRQMAVEETTSQDQALIPAVALSMCNGRLPDDWRLPADPELRTRMVCELLLSLAAETGALSTGTVACRILRLHQMNMTFPLQKLLMCAFAAHARRRLDWEARTSGALTGAVIDWRTKYFKTVEEDLDKAASGMSDLTTSSALDEDEFGEEDEEGEEEEDENGNVVRKPRRDATDEDGLQAYEERLASGAGVSPSEYDDDDGLFEGTELNDEGVEARKRKAALAFAKNRKGMPKQRREDEDDDEERQSDEVAAMDAADDMLEGTGGGGSEFDDVEEEDDEEVFIDPATKSDVSTYFTSGSLLTRAQNLKSSSKVMDKKHQRRDENMRRRLLSRITKGMGGGGGGGGRGGRGGGSGRGRGRGRSTS